MPTHDGGRVPLSQLADIKVVNGASIIARRENHRQISVRTNIRGRDQGSFVKEAQQRFDARCQTAAGLLGGLGRAVREPGARPQAAHGHSADHHRDHLRAAVLRVRLDAVHAGLVLVNVPFSLVGGIVFLYLRGINLSVSARGGLHLACSEWR